MTDESKFTHRLFFFIGVVTGAFFGWGVVPLFLGVWVIVSVLEANREKVNP